MESNKRKITCPFELSVKFAKLEREEKAEYMTWKMMKDIREGKANIPSPSVNQPEMLSELAVAALPRRYYANLKCNLFNPSMVDRYTWLGIRQHVLDNTSIYNVYITKHGRCMRCRNNGWYTPIVPPLEERSNDSMFEVFKYCSLHEEFPIIYCRGCDNNCVALDYVMQSLYHRDPKVIEGVMSINEMYNSLQKHELLWFHNMDSEDHYRRVRRGVPDDSETHDERLGYTQLVELVYNPEVEEAVEAVE